MALKTYKPNTPGLRQRIVLVRSEITADKPEKSLTKNLHKKAGRDTFGRVSVRRRGGGHKRAYRIIDFSRDKYGVPGVVKTIEYDPNRSVNIALVFYKDGEKRYILAPKGLTVGTTVVSGPSAPLTVGNALCYATIGVLGNEDHMNISLGKAGASRHLGRRPKVRGVVMNPIDHPHGGGEGKTAAGRHPVTPWGKPTKGGKTRSKKKPSNSFIVKRRK